MIVTNEKLKKAFVISIFLAVALVLPSSTWATAGSPQNCTVASSCIVGEFLYDDEYAPVTTGTCNITSRYPDGTLYIDDELMTLAPENDGWYSYSFTTPSTLGSYRTDVCCTVDTELICIDKTFDVVQDESSDEIAGAVWGYSNRSLSSFGSLVSDIWDYSSRSLTSLGSLVRDIWIHEDRTLTDADLDEGKLVTQSDSGSDIDLSKIERTVGENRLLLEQLVNKPIIESFLEEEEDIDLSEKLKNTRAITNQMYVNNQYLTTKSASLVSSWNRVSSRERLDNVISLNSLLGEETDSSSSDTIFGSINWMRQSWDWEDGQDIYAQAKKAKKNMTSSQASLATYGGANSSYSSMKLAVRNLVELEKLIGSSTDSVQKRTLYGKIRQVEEHVAVLNTREGEVDALLADWKKVKDSKGTKAEINDIQRRVIAINEVPKASTILNAKSDEESIVKILKNKLLAIKGIINANKRLLAVGAGKGLTSTWLEEGSIVFKTLATNPSKLISQDVEIKYYLPQEVREEDIITVDEGLTISYDSETDKYYAEGKFNLAAGESKAFSVKVDDIWKITEQEVDSLRRQAEELSKPLENTSFFAQGVTLKSDIDASLDKIITLQENAVTPEQQIRAYREAAIEKQAVEQKMVSMQDLVTQAGSTGTLFGFVGGAQTLAVWGLIIIMAIGFVFLALYMRTVTKLPAKSKKKKGTGKSDEKSGQKTPGGSGFDLIKIIKFATPFAIIALVSASLSGLIVARIVSNSIREEVLGQQTTLDSNDVESESEDELEGGETALGGLDIVWLDVPDGSSVEVMSDPSSEGEVIMETTVSQEVVRIDELEEWVNILLDDEEALEFASEGWVSAEYIVVPSINRDEEDELGSLSLDSMVLIEETSTGWLRVRSDPKGVEIDKVSPGETFELLDEVTDWYEIQVDEDTSGWVSKQYSSIE